MFDSYGGKAGDISLLKALEAYGELTQLTLHPTQLRNYLMSKTGDHSINNNNNNGFSSMDQRISFDKFCALVAEFTTDGCDTCRNGRMLDACYWACAFVNTRHLLKCYVVRPFTNVLGIGLLKRMSMCTARACLTEEVGIGDLASFAFQSES